MENQVKVLDLEGKEVETLDLPNIFKVPIREDIINKAYVALDSRRRNPQGRDPMQVSVQPLRREIPQPVEGSPGFPG